jgi:hypothetical protein
MEEQTVARPFVLSPSGAPTMDIISHPNVVYSTLLGSWEGEAILDVAVDSSGAAYVIGYSNSTDLIPPDVPGFDQDPSFFDAVIAKLSPNGDSLIYIIYLGGSSNDNGGGISLEEDGTAYIVGSTDSDDLIPSGITGFDLSLNGGEDAFLAKLSSDGTSLLYMTYLGGSLNDSSGAIALDSNQNTYVMGEVCPPSIHTWTAIGMALLRKSAQVVMPCFSPLI